MVFDKAAPSECEVLVSGMYGLVLKVLSLGVLISTVAVSHVRPMHN